MAAPRKPPMSLINGTYYLNAESAAQFCGVSKSTMIAWRKQPDTPIFNDDVGMYSAIELGEWIRTRQIYRKGKGGTYPWLPDISDFPASHRPAPVAISLPGMESTHSYDEDMDERIKRLRGDKLEMELQERAGELVNADEVLIALSSMISRVKMRILSLPQALASTVTGMTDRIEVQTIIEDKIHASLDELSADPMKEIAGDD